MCSVVAHEWGHLLGSGHVSDPNSLMNPVTPINFVAGCPTWGLSAAKEPAQTATTTKRKASKPRGAATKRSSCASKPGSSRRRAKSRRRCATPAKRRSHKR